MTIRTSQKIVDESYKSIKNISLRKNINIDNSLAERPNKILGFGKNGDYTYEEYFVENKKNKQLSKYEINEKIIKLIHNNLSCVPMSEGPKAHIMTYEIYDDLDCDTDEKIDEILSGSEVITINKNRYRLGETLTYWLHRSRQLADKEFTSMRYKLPNDNCKLTRFILRGKPGVGKTALLNYLFAINRDCLQLHKVMWIRVDLSRPRGRDLQLRTLIYNTFVRIFCRYYLHEKEDLKMDFINKLEEYLIKKARNSKLVERKEKDPQSLVNQFIDFLAHLYDIQNEDRIKRPNISVLLSEHDLDNSLISNDLIKWLLEYLQTKNCYGYLFILDGLDSVTIDYAQEKLFNEWISLLDGVTDNCKNNYKAVYVCSMRDYSLIELYKRLTQGMSEDFKELRVVPQPINAILNNRVYYISNISASGYDLVSSVNNIINNLIKIVFNALKINKKDDELFEYFVFLNNENLRSTMRFFRELIPVINLILDNNFYEALSSKIMSSDTIDMIERKEWVVVQLLLFGDSEKRLYKNRVQFENEYYKFNDDSEEPLSAIRIDNHSKSILPNIFNYNEVNSKKYPYHPLNLFKLRVIQYLSFLDGNHSDEFTIIRWYNENFNFDDIDLRQDFREMIYNGIISPQCSESKLMMAVKENKSIPVSLSGLGFALFEHIINNFLYYEIICDDTPIISKFKTLIVPLSKFEKYLTTHEYLYKKSKSIFYFLIYLQKLEQFEIENFISKNGVDAKSLYEKRYLIFSDNRINDIKQSLSRYLAGMLKVRKNRGIKWRDDYIEQWYDYHDVPLDSRK